LLALYPGATKITYKYKDIVGEVSLVVAGQKLRPSATQFNALVGIERSWTVSKLGLNVSASCIAQAEAVCTETDKDIQIRARSAEEGSKKLRVDISANGIPVDFFELDLMFKKSYQVSDSSAHILYVDESDFVGEENGTGSIIIGQHAKGSVSKYAAESGSIKRSVDYSSFAWRSQSEIKYSKLSDASIITFQGLGDFFLSSDGNILTYYNNQPGSALEPRQVSSYFHKDKSTRRFATFTEYTGFTGSMLYTYASSSVGGSGRDIGTVALFSPNDGIGGSTTFSNASINPAGGLMAISGPDVWGSYNRAIYDEVGWFKASLPQAVNVNGGIAPEYYKFAASNQSNRIWAEITPRFQLGGGTIGTSLYLKDLDSGDWTLIDDQCAVISLCAYRDVNFFGNGNLFYTVEMGGLFERKVRFKSGETKKYAGEVTISGARNGDAYIVASMESFKIVKLKGLNWIESQSINGTTPSLSPSGGVMAFTRDGKTYVEVTPD
jgi:hypothetical protein